MIRSRNTWDLFSCPSFCAHWIYSMGIPITEENVLHTHTNKGTSTGILNVIKFELLIVITLKETICLRIWAKALPKNGKKRSLLLNMHHSEMPFIQLPDVLSLVYYQRQNIAFWTVLPHFGVHWVLQPSRSYLSFFCFTPPPPSTCNQIIKYGCITLFLESTWSLTTKLWNFLLLSRWYLLLKCSLI